MQWGSESLVAPLPHVTGGGDSGGPWFYSNTAYGIHHGVMEIWWKNQSLFSPVIYLDDVLGITIGTS